METQKNLSDIRSNEGCLHLRCEMWIWPVDILVNILQELWCYNACLCTLFLRLDKHQPVETGLTENNTHLIGITEGQKYFLDSPGCSRRCKRRKGTLTTLKVGNASYLHMAVSVGRGPSIHHFDQDLFMGLTSASLGSGSPASYNSSLTSHAIIVTKSPRL